MEWNKREEELISYLESQKLSQSHELDHLRRVAGYAQGLAQAHGGREEIVVAGALLHDLGRTGGKYRGAESAQKGAEMAEEPLHKAGYNDEEIVDILRCIAEHDQPELHSDLLEARILKDADFLDGFGAWGVMRSIMYSTEIGEGVEGAVQRMRVKMRQRLDGLEFLESKRLGWRMYRLVDYLLAELERTYEIEEVSYPGRLVVIEGISGCGKDTQAELLMKWFKEQGKEAVVVNHPTVFMKERVWRAWREQTRDPLSELLLIAADRARVTKEEILPALREGKVVVSTRSSVSAQVYQVVEGLDPAFHRLIFSFEPWADLLVYLDVDVETAWERTGKRVEQGKEQDRGFFGQKQQGQKDRFTLLWDRYPNVMRIDANGAVEEVSNALIKEVMRTGVVGDESVKIQK